METSSVNLSSSIRSKISIQSHQNQCLNLINEKLTEQDSGLVEMFCGTGKSLVEFITLSNFEKSLIVFPSIGLVRQFNDDYIKNFGYPYEHLSICSELESTTEMNAIKRFLKANKKFLICCTFQSLDTFLKVCKETKTRINLSIYDEAHHIVGDQVQKLIFGEFQTITDKSLFFTATPKNANGISMTKNGDRESDCGPIIFKYTHHQAVGDYICRDFEICLNLSMQLNEKNIFKCIARNALATDNYRILCFNAGVNETGNEKTAKRTKVMTFASEKNKKEFERIFIDIRDTEFPEKKHINKIRFEGFGKMDLQERKKILTEFDNCPDDQVFLISSCQTIKEGIDTKKCNHICWADPKQSYVEIIQNIGRGARKKMGDKCDLKKFTVSIPVYIDKEKYEGCEDAEKRDLVIREEMNESENWNGITNVLSALRQSDPVYYDLCIKYPNKFCRKDIEKELKIGEKIAQIESENGKEEINPEDVITLVNDYCSNLDQPIELYTNSMEQPTKSFGVDKEGDERILYFDDETNELFEAAKNKEIDEDGIERPVQHSRRKRFNMKVHMDNDLKVLWGIRDGYDLMKEITTVYLDCQVVENEQKWMEYLEECVKFKQTNNKYPSHHHSKEHEERRLGIWLAHQRTILNETANVKMSEVRKKLLQDKLSDWFFYDSEQEWIQNLDSCFAFKKVNNRYPYPTSKDPEEKRLGNWLSNQRRSLNNKGCGKMTEERKKLLQDKLSDWFFYDQEEEWIQNLESCLDFKKENNRYPSSTSKDIKEKRLAKWLSSQRRSLNNKGRGKMTEERKKLLQDKLSDWFFYDQEEEWIQNLESCLIFKRKNNRYPYPTSKDPEEKRLGNWLSCQRTFINGKSTYNIPENRKQILQQRLTDWFNFSKEDKWMDNLKACINFKITSGKYPSDSSKIQEEKRLGSWLRNQRTSLNGTGKAITIERKQILKEKIPDWFYKNQSKSGSFPKPRSYLRPIPNPKEKTSTSTRSKFSSSELSAYHKKFKTLHASNYFSFVQSNPEEFKKYYHLSKQAEEHDHPEDKPLNVIAEQLNRLPANQLIADLGCGDATLSTFCPSHRFENFDAFALDSCVQVCDITNLPSKYNNTFDVVVLCRAMWACNKKDILNQVYNIMKPNGMVYICEPFKRWNWDKDTMKFGENRLVNLLRKCNLKVVESRNTSIQDGMYNKFMYFTCKKEPITEQDIDYDLKLKYLSEPDKWFGISIDDVPLTEFKCYKNKK